VQSGSVSGIIFSYILKMLLWCKCSAKKAPSES